MGADKALLQYQGRSFLEAIVKNIHEAGIETIVAVLGYHAAEIQKAVLLQGVQIVVNSTYRLGQTSSVQAGLKALDLAGLDSVLLSLVDHPAVPAGVIRQLLKARQDSEASVVIPVHGGRRGHPVLIGRALFTDLLDLDPGMGANSVIHRYRNSTREVSMEDPSVLIDVDLPEDYQQLVTDSRRNAGSRRQ